ncbi:hypothetical protein AABB24_003774 [Solanum stoloniferum]|uniref:Senescence regulator n=2 Tax=Solanum TaxID=4107 RepID=A0AAF0Q4M2_SOLVR|nr:uncharacterized protein LOC125822192 [Solanum verrucosum]WMV16277.1 hypothetical protein MTR67_009662 [Solanum verrucosum]
MEEFNSNRNKGKTEKDGDFEEEDVWGYVNERDSSRVIPPRGKSNKCVLHKSSSPVEIPEWPKNSNKQKSRRVRTDDGSSFSSVTYSGNVEEEDDDYGDGIVPPHEYIARRVARNQIASFSMMEGVGRTLKGRDLSKLRNAILTKTGFLE